MSLKIFKKIIHNWHIKLLSLALAALLWIYVDNIKEKERFLSVPLEIKNIPAEYIVSNSVPNSVKVVLKGKERNLALINENTIKAYIDFENNTKTRVKKIVKIDKDSIPHGVSVKEISPGIIEAGIESIEKKMVKVVPVIIEEPPYGYEVEDVIIEPEEIGIKGPESLMTNIDSVYTKDINIGKLTETTVKEVGINLEDNKLSPVSDRVIDVKVIIKEVYVVKRINNIPIIPVNLKEGLKAVLKDSSVSVLTKIPKRIEKSFTSDQVFAYIECEVIDEPGIFHLPVLFKTEWEGVTFIKFEPRSIEIVIEGEETVIEDE